jgi:hypothetical protein
MAALYSTMFANFRGASGDSAPLEPPDGTLWVVRDVSIWNGNLAVVTAASITTTDATTLCQANASFSIGAWWFHAEVRWVIPPGHFIQLHADFPCDFYVCGYQLTEP